MAEKDTELEKSVKEIPVLIKKLKELFSKEEKFTEIKAGEKTYKYSSEKFEIGTEVFEGEKPLADGDYDFEAGKFTVKAGKVIEIKPKEAAATNPDFSAQLKAQVKEINEKFATQKTDFDAQVKEIKAAFDKKFDELIKGKLKEIVDIVEKIAALPQAPSAFKKKDGEPSIPTSQARVAELMAKAKKDITDKVFNS